MQTTAYGIRTVLDLPYDEALGRARAALTSEGFGVLCEIDIQAKLREKLGVDMRPYMILGACNPPLAHQALEQEPSLSFRVWVGLPAILFDRTHGLAAVAPWAFLALTGLAPALRAQRARLLPAAVAIAVTLGALSLFRYWEGGYAPPARYLVEVVPLAAPFVAYGLVVARRWLSALLLGLGALATFLLAAIPTLGLNSAFEHKLRNEVGAALGADPLGWLPSFQPVTPDWYVAAYLRLLPALALAALLVWLGRRRSAA